MTTDYLLQLRDQLISLGYQEEIDWQEHLKPCMESWNFAQEAIWVILNSGMKEQIARIISTRIWTALREEQDISTVFGHKGKVAAIKHILSSHGTLFEGYCKAANKLDYLQTIPFIGGITKYHLAKNLGHDCVKPDRHLVRIAKMYNIDCISMCKVLARNTGYRVATIDIILWRAANLGLI